MKASLPTARMVNLSLVLAASLLAATLDSVARSIWEGMQAFRYSQMKMDYQVGQKGEVENGGRKEYEAIQAAVRFSSPSDTAFVDPTLRY